MWDYRSEMPTPEEVTPPAAEPVSLQELKLHCRVDLDDDDAKLINVNRAARRYFENALDKQLVTATWKVRYPYFPGWEFELPYPPLQSATIQYKDSGLATQTLSTSVYNVVTWRTPGLIQLKNGQAWPATGIDPGAVTVTFVAGFGDPTRVSDLVKAGIQMMAAHLYLYREAIAEGIVSSVPLGVDSIIASERAYRF